MDIIMPKDLAEKGIFEYCEEANVREVCRCKQSHIEIYSLYCADCNKKKLKEKKDKEKKNKEKKDKRKTDNDINFCIGNDLFGDKIKPIGKICPRCTIREKNKGQGYCYECNREAALKHHHAGKMRAFLAYGNKCFCCGDTDIKHLEIDHILSNGNIDRKNRKGIHTWRLAEEKGYPNTFQLLCANCHKEKTENGMCQCEEKRLEGKICLIPFKAPRRPQIY